MGTGLSFLGLVLRGSTWTSGSSPVVSMSISESDAKGLGDQNLEEVDGTVPLGF